MYILLAAWPRLSQCGSDRNMLRLRGFREILWRSVWEVPRQGPAYNLATPIAHNYQVLFPPFFLSQKMLFSLAVAFCFVRLISSLPQDMDKVHELERRQLANVISQCTVPNTVALTFVSFWIYFPITKQDTHQWIRTMVPTIICSWIRTIVFPIFTWWCLYFSYAVDGILRDNGGVGTFFFSTPYLAMLTDSVQSYPALFRWEQL